MSQNKLTIIQDSVIVAMSADKRFTDEFPFLKGVQNAKTVSRGGCSRCGRSNSYKADRMAAAKRTIANMSGAQKTKLKQLLNTKQARVMYVAEGGQRRELTF